MKRLTIFWDLTKVSATDFGFFLKKIDIACRFYCCSTLTYSTPL
ncbi:hypothetical protein GARC_3701 [Paraglaciecola arctica BSs20135]|uniref:Uncharacterized protein n=1 Tax=Paraglaciecola arctica BSs20135 TaxID=493475 RepID=K6ZB35_9ALTE|nr:hypothetical protein GARC_3701 [Paraglaciecola arctica BSs20135]